METSNIGSVLQALYDSEIHFSIHAFWHAGFDWDLGLEPGPESGGNAPTLREAVQQLVDAALREYPTSVFALNVKHGGVIEGNK
jgi:hypothetical protein